MPTIFVSYRRKDSDAITGHIVARLRTSYRKTAVFVDVSSIPIAAEFPALIRRAMRGCRIVIAVIGPAWHGPTDEGPSRVQQEGDFVRLEIELGLASGADLFPVLVGGAEMPSEQALPDNLRLLREKNAVQVNAGADFDHHMRRLIGGIDGALIARMRYRTYGVRASLCVLGISTAMLGLSLFGGGSLHLALLGASAAGFGLVLAYAAMRRMLGIDVPHRLALPLGIAATAIMLAAFYLPPMLLRAPRAALGSQEEVLASAKELHDEFAQARAVLKKTGSADFSGAEAIAVSLNQLDGENGHALYYRDEIDRVQATTHFGADSCLKPLPRQDLESFDIYRKGFYRYLEVEKMLPESETGGGPEWQLCYQRAKGYCRQRTAWINHLLANDLYQEALAASDSESRLAKLDRARNYAEAALEYHPPGQAAGFAQCLDTKVLIKKIDQNIASVR